MTFSKKDLLRLNEADSKLKDVMLLIDKGKKCEINCDVAEAIVGEMQRKIDLLRQEFFNNPTQLD